MEEKYWRTIDKSVHEWSFGGEADAKRALDAAIREAWHEGFVTGRERAKRSVDPIQAAVISTASVDDEWLERLRQEMLARGCTDAEAEAAVMAERLDLAQDGT